MATSSEKIQKVVLAYSGGLDTSVILPWLKETYGCKVVAFAAELGQGDELRNIRRKAMLSGADKCIVVDLRRRFVEQFCWRLLKSGAVYEHEYLLGTSIARPLIAAEQVRIAHEENADAVAHGATGKGNDQVRFELTYMALDPSLKIIAPWRDPRFTLTSREAALEYAREKNIPVSATKRKIYSRDRNIWHISHEGAELEDIRNEPQDRMWTISVPVAKAPDRPAYVTVNFKDGTPVGLNGRKMPAVRLLEQLNRLGGRHAVGQTHLIENRLVGIKSHGAYETPGGTILTVAHRALESVCLDRETAHFKQQVALKYAELIYYGQWFCPLREAIDAFMDATQHGITGEVRVKLFKGRCTVAAIDSPNSLYQPKLASFEMTGFDATDATGFIRLFGLPQRVRAATVKTARRRGNAG